METSSANVQIVGKCLPWAFYRLFCLKFSVSKTTCSKHFTWNLRELSFLNLVTNSLLSLLCPFTEAKKQESNFQEVGNLVTRNISVFCLEQAILYSTRYSCLYYTCLYYSSMVQQTRPTNCTNCDPF